MNGEFKSIHTMTPNDIKNEKIVQRELVDRENIINKVDDEKLLMKMQTVSALKFL